MFAKAIASSIPSFELFSLTTNEFKWLQPEAWSSEQELFFLENRQKYFDQILRHPAFSRKEKNFSGLKLNWLLVNEEDQPNGWVEAHGFKHRFYTFMIFVPVWDHTPFAHESLSLLVSALFITSRCDRIQIVGLRPPSMKMIGGFEWGETTSIYQFLPDLERGWLTQKELFKTYLVTIDQFNWWEREHAKADKDTLHYLVQRIRRHERIREEVESPPRRRRGILATLFGRR